MEAAGNFRMSGSFVLHEGTVPDHPLSHGACSSHQRLPGTNPWVQEQPGCSGINKAALQEQEEQNSNGEMLLRALICPLERFGEAGPAQGTAWPLLVFSGVGGALSFLQAPTDFC